MSGERTCDLGDRIRSEADLAARPGQLERLTRIAAEVDALWWALRQYDIAAAEERAEAARLRLIAGWNEPSDPEADSPASILRWHKEHPELGLSEDQ